MRARPRSPRREERGLRQAEETWESALPLPPTAFQCRATFTHRGLRSSEVRLLQPPLLRWTATPPSLMWAQTCLPPSTARAFLSPPPPPPQPTTLQHPAPHPYSQAAPHSETPTSPTLEMLLLTPSPLTQAQALRSRSAPTRETTSLWETTTRSWWKGTTSAWAWAPLLLRNA